MDVSLWARKPSLVVVLAKVLPLASRIHCAPWDFKFAVLKPALHRVLMPAPSILARQSHNPAVVYRFTFLKMCQPARTYNSPVVGPTQFIQLQTKTCKDGDHN